MTRGENTPNFSQLTVREVMVKEVQFGHQQTKGDVLASLMIDGFGSVPVVDDEQILIGIVTEFDLLAVLDKGQRLSDVSASQIMTKDPIRVYPHTDLRTAIRVLQTNHLIRMPVVDQDSKLIGILARRDILLGYVTSKMV